MENSADLGPQEAKNDAVFYKKFFSLPLVILTQVCLYSENA